MTSIEIPYEIYAILPEDQRDEIDFQISYGGLVEKNYFTDKGIENYSFETVKKLQSDVFERDFEQLFADIISLPEYNDFEKRLCYEVILSVKKVTNDVMNTIELENNLLISSVQSEHDYSYEQEQVDFTMFDREFFQLNELADGDITKFDTIRKIDYAKCFTMLLYKQKQSDLSKLIMRRSKKN